MTASRAPRLIVYAPNVHTGGGLVLLQALAASDAMPPLLAFVDARARQRLPLPANAQVIEVAATPWHRLHAELALRRHARAHDTLLCFHSLPPLLRSPARTLVFVQNRVYVERGSLRGYRWSTRIRLALERAIARVFRSHVSEYVVQTPTMRRAIERWHGAMPAVRVLPFVDALPDEPAGDNGAAARTAEWDFVYVSDGQWHKNHRGLIAAWCLLAQQGLRPSLALTLGPRDSALREAIDAESSRCGLRVRNFDSLTRDDVVALYRRSRALIFPSTLESFGLPLIEAQRCGLPILAPELDYVRDVCEPAQTFDPRSPQSIARAVKRFLGCPDAPLRPGSATEFLRELLR